MGARDLPGLALMHAGFFLAGFATLLLGPILPLLSRQWRLDDAHAGMLLLAQFTGATLGGATVSRHLPRAFLLGLLSAAAGFAIFAYAPQLWIACAGLLLGGFGIGRIIASVNILAGARYTSKRGSALSQLNFSFSLGALLSPLLAANVVPHAGLRLMLNIFAGALVLVALFFAWQLRGLTPEQATAHKDPCVRPLLRQIFLLFVFILFLYGGLETCFAGWLTTYTLRYGSGSLASGQYTLVLLLCGLTAGRAGSAWLLLRVSGVSLLRLSLVLTIGLAAALVFTTNGILLGILAVLLGGCLSPIFPVSFALLMARQPSAQQAGLVLAASGLGAAAIPWLMGLISTHAGGLRPALVLPVTTAATLLMLSFFMVSHQEGLAPAPTV